MRSSQNVIKGVPQDEARELLTCNIEDFKIFQFLFLQTRQLQVKIFIDEIFFRKPNWIFLK